MDAARNLLSSSPSFQTKTHLKNTHSSPPSVMMLREQTVPAVSSRHVSSISRHFPASVLSQEPRDEYKPLSHSFKEDRTSQVTMERRQLEDTVSSRENEKFEQRMLNSICLWNMLLGSVTAEKQTSSVVSPLEDAEPYDVVAMAKEALSASKRAAVLAEDSKLYPSDTGNPLSTSSGESLLEERTIVRSKRLLQRRAKNRKAPKSNALENEGYVSQQVNVKKKLKQGLDPDDPLQLFLWGPETKQLLSAKEESELVGQIQDLIRLEKVKRKLQSEYGREPTIGEWGEALGLSCQALKSELHRGRSSREKLITANLRLVVHIAKQYQGRGLNLQDMLQEGSMGLMKSVEKFKPQSGCRFATYAYWWIRQSIRKAIFQKSRTIRLPENVYALLGKVTEAKRTLVNEGNHRPGKEELARRVGVSKEKLEKLMYNTRTPLSIQQPVWADQDTTLQEITADTAVETPDMIVGKQLMRNHVRNLLSVLSPKERSIIKLRFGIDGGKPRSLSEIGAIYGLSKERVRQLESRALYRLKQNLTSHGLNAYAEFLV
ncbi:PREDICTED: RNA polymerase sigma factor sigF, chloroplastic [Tarenaya hassleriana]|uniref:RNA polymerase sigma factor sigF, chloroplastic n=1 Tax=Tarenaya hassleriana TaxID=28532 RepID=UPI00053C2BA6|nr:PREDICTED: RNA polymerase sigma factor sigF, chloroplastic [Tarenaya hassleriana]